MIRQHYLWTMDGRQWIEVASPGDRHVSLGMEMGFAKPIPSDLLYDLVKKVEDGAAAAS